MNFSIVVSSPLVLALWEFLHNLVCFSCGGIWLYMKRFASDIVPTHIAGMGATVIRGFSQESTIYVRFFSHPVIKKIGPLRLSNESA